jgi:hypothetical protein
LGGECEHQGRVEEQLDQGTEQELLLHFVFLFGEGFCVMLICKEGFGFGDELSF